MNPNASSFQMLFPLALLNIPHTISTVVITAVEINAVPAMDPAEESRQRALDGWSGGNPLVERI